MKRYPQICIAIAIVAFAALGLGLFMVGHASAQTGPPPPFVTDYVNYPLPISGSQLPPGCDFSGVLGAGFFLNGLGVNGSTTVGFASLGAIPPFKAGDTLTMRWTDIGAECVGVPVVLTVKHAKSPFFDINALQPAASRYGLTIATAGPGSVSLVLPDLSIFDADCFAQLDAIVGIPLAVVGKAPNGSFYNNSTRGDTLANVLIGFNNGQYSACVAAPTTTTTTTTQATTTTGGATTTTTPVTTTTGPGATTTTLLTTITSRAPIPNTGPRSLERNALAGGILLVAGAIGLALSLAFLRREMRAR